MEQVLRKGTQVAYSGAWNTDPEEIVTIEGLQKCKEKGDKYGDNVDEISWAEKDYGVYDLSNGHWCYGYQIHEIISEPEKNAEKEYRISFRAEVYIKGKDLKSARSKWEEIGIFSAEALEEYGADFIDLESVERVDDESYEEVTTAFKRS